MSVQTNPSAPTSEETSSGLLLAISWVFVGLPLAWGVAQTFIKALALFK